MGPVTAGFLADFFKSWTVLFPFSSIMLIFAFVFLLLVKKGEANEVIDKSLRCLKIKLQLQFLLFSFNSLKR